LSSSELSSVKLAHWLTTANVHTVLLNSCWSGQFQGLSFTEFFAAIGIPNILAMNQPANDSAAIQFAHSFYTGLAQGRSLEQALTDARRDMFMQSHEPSLNWGLPTAIFDTPELCLVI
jgi:hypothetical protein